MKAWGVEVKSGEPFKVMAAPHGMILRITQANLGVPKEEEKNECVYLFVNSDEKKLVLGTLITQKLPQQSFDLSFERDFELSHTWESGSVFFHGYMLANPFLPFDDPMKHIDDFGFEEDLLPTTGDSEKLESKAKQEKPVEAAAKGEESDAGKQKVSKDVKVESSGVLVAEDANKDNFEDEDDEKVPDDAGMMLG